MREALRLLEREGQVTYRPRRGCPEPELFAELDAHRTRALVVLRGIIGSPAAA